MSLYSDLIKVANQLNMLQPLNVDEVLSNRSGGSGMMDLGMLATMPLYNVADTVLNPIHSLIPAMHPVTGAGSMGLIYALQELMSKKQREKSLREEGQSIISRSPFTILDNQMNQIRQRSHRLGEGV